MDYTVNDILIEKKEKVNHGERLKSYYEAIRKKQGRKGENKNA